MHLNDHTFLECCIAQQQCKVQDLTLQLEEANVLLREFKVFDRDAASAQRHKVQQLTLQVEAANMALFIIIQPLVGNTGALALFGIVAR